MPKNKISPLFLYKIVRLNPTRVKLKVFTRDGYFFATNTFPDENAAIEGFNKGDYYVLIQPF
jgi:hypothetical protein